jgi:hypothetical protein
VSRCGKPAPSRNSTSCSPGIAMLAPHPPTPPLLSGRAPARSTAPYFITAFFIHSVDTDFGRTMAEPMALLMIACAQIPMARDTLKSTV